MSDTRSSGIGFCGLLTIVFIALKLTNNIDWSWVWVLSPLWGSVALGIVLFIIFGIALMRSTRKTEKEFVKRMNENRKR